MVSIEKTHVSKFCDFLANFVNVGLFEPLFILRKQNGDNHNHFNRKTCIAESLHHFSRTLFQLELIAVLSVFLVYVFANQGCFVIPTLAITLLLRDKSDRNAITTYKSFLTYYHDKVFMKF